jgi:hypothetical protein
LPGFYDYSLATLIDMRTWPKRQRLTVWRHDDQNVGARFGHTSPVDQVDQDLTQKRREERFRSIRETAYGIPVITLIALKVSIHPMHAG